MTEALDALRVAKWFRQKVPGVSGSLQFELISGGNSNLTYTVEDGSGKRWILRRPPVGPLQPTAHDMMREYTIIRALAPTQVPVPNAVAVCDDDAVTGAPFYVMDAVMGTVIRTETHLAVLSTPAQRHRLGLELVEVLAQIHSVRLEEVGLDQLGRKDHYLNRQLSRWSGQLHLDTSTDHPALTEAYNLLLEHIPTAADNTLVHGDYRLENCIVGDGTVLAVLDWELATIGDPLADLGWLAAYWPGSGLSSESIRMGPNIAGFPSRDEMLRHYAIVSGRNLFDIDYYLAYSYWRLACIVEGILTRYRAGAMSSKSRNPEELTLTADRLTAEACAIARTLK